MIIKIIMFITVNNDNFILLGNVRIANQYQVSVNKIRVDSVLDYVAQNSYA